ncbi:MAG: hypothetical protein ACREF4_20090, partial [Gammaproteobacteria bacterium]
MIPRIWHGWTIAKNAAAYERLLKDQIFPGIAARGVVGYRGIQLLRRKVQRAILLTAAGIVFGFGFGQAQTINVWPGVAPGSENWTHKEVTVDDTPLGTVVINVVTPTLTVYL